MKVGMTGGRSGVTDDQLERFKKRLIELEATELHHGDCTGADAQAHKAARELGLRIVVHPPVDSLHRAFCKGDEVLPPLEYLQRNRAIVDATDFLIVLPDRPETLRSGTWATFRYARAAGSPIEVIA